MNHFQLATAQDLHQRLPSIGTTISLLFGLVFMPIHSFADTVARGFPFGGQVQITVYKGTLGQGDDRDARVLMDAMNVPLQNSPLGPGKAIVDSAKLLNWTCADRGQAGYHCALLVRPGQGGSELQSRTQISPPAVTYVATGEVALELFEMLVPTTPGFFEFENQEQTLKISATPEKFELVYRE